MKRKIRLEALVGVLARLRMAGGLIRTGVDSLEWECLDRIRKE